MRWSKVLLEATKSSLRYCMSVWTHLNSNGSSSKEINSCSTCTKRSPSAACLWARTSPARSSSGCSSKASRQRASAFRPPRATVASASARSTRGCCGCVCGLRLAVEPLIAPLVCGSLLAEPDRRRERRRARHRRDQREPHDALQPAHV